MEWVLLCGYYDAMILALEATGYKRVESLSQFWEKDNSSAHLLLSANDGVSLTVNGINKAWLKRHPDHI